MVLFIQLSVSTGSVKVKQLKQFSRNQEETVGEIPYNFLTRILVILISS